MSTSLLVDAGQSGALFDLSGFVPNNSTWDEYIYFFDGADGLDLTGQSFQIQIRDRRSTTATILQTLTTAAGDLVLTNDGDGVTSILRINVPYTSISALEGAYIVDLVSKDANSKLIHWASGLVSFRQNPVAF